MYVISGENFEYCLQMHEFKYQVLVSLSLQNLHREMKKFCQKMLQNLCMFCGVVFRNCLKIFQMMWRKVI